MKFIPSLFVVFILTVFSQVNGSEPYCFNDNLFTGIFNTSNLHNDAYAEPIEVTGLIKSISSDTAIETFGDTNIFFHANDSSKWSFAIAKKISLTKYIANHDSIFNNLPSESMLTEADSSSIYVPFNLAVKLNDSIYISNYRAVFDGHCSSGHTYYTGSYQIFRDGIEIDQFAKDSSSVSVLPHPKKRATPKTKNSLYGYDLQGRIRTQGRQQILLFKR